MKKSAKIWLVIAIILCTLTTILNFVETRYISVVLATISIICLLVLLLKQKKIAFKILVITYILSAIYSILTNLNGNILVNIIMSVVGSLIIPLITYLFIKGDYSNLK